MIAVGSILCHHEINGYLPFYYYSIEKKLFEICPKTLEKEEEGGGAVPILNLEKPNLERKTS